LSELFIKHAPQTLKELDAALAIGDAEAARASAHKLKGSCLAVGAGLMTEAAQAAQHAAESGDLEAARRHAAGLHPSLARVVTLLRGEVTRVRSATTRPNGSRPPPREVGT
jgi:HPt (histidine-containing phosphotransfer) domain-containing protein